MPTKLCTGINFFPAADHTSLNMLRACEFVSMSPLLHLALIQQVLDSALDCHKRQLLQILLFDDWSRTSFVSGATPGFLCSFVSFAILSVVTLFNVTTYSLKRFCLKWRSFAETLKTFRCLDQNISLRFYKIHKKIKQIHEEGDKAYIPKEAFLQS